MTALTAEKERRVRYNIQIRPGKTTLVAEFPEGQDELLGRFVELLLPEQNGKDKPLNAQPSSGNMAFARIIREK